MKETLDCLNICLSNSCLNTLSTLLYKWIKRGNPRDIKNNGKMPSRELAKFIVTLLHNVTSPRHRRHGRHGGRHSHTLECWSSPGSLPPTGRRSGQWSPQTQCLSVGSSRSAMCHPWLGTMPQPGCTGA
jgi:hypothetical protein